MIAFKWLAIPLAELRELELYGIHINWTFLFSSRCNVLREDLEKKTIFTNPEEGVHDDEGSSHHIREHTKKKVKLKRLWYLAWKEPSSNIWMAASVFVQFCF